MEKIKLSILKKLLIMLFNIVEVVTLFKHKEYHYPVKWLNHFLKGSGKPLKVPNKVVQQATSVFNHAVWRDNWGNLEYYCKIEGKYCVSHSTLYEGSGFSNRPTLFYLLGGFSFELKQWRNNTYWVSGTDTYDWHSDGSGRYFSSPIGDSPVIMALTKIAGLLFGKDLFIAGEYNESIICADSETHMARISNKLWEAMYEVGAKDFVSEFNAPLPNLFSKKDLEDLDNVMFYWEHYGEDYFQSDEYYYDSLDDEK